MNVLEKLDYIDGLIKEVEGGDVDKAKAAVMALQFHATLIAKALLEVAFTPDPVVREVQYKLINRSRRGMEIYGVSMEANPLCKKEWIDHMVEELLDAANYATRLKAEIK